MAVLGELQRRDPEGANTALSSWNFNVELNQAIQRDGGEPHKARRACAIAMEGWQWLRNNGFLAPHPDHHGEWETLTRAGRAADAKRYIAESRALEVLREVDLDPELRRTVEALFVRGKYDDAVMAAMRLVEDRVRFAGRYSNSDIGVSLMRKALGQKESLRDAALDPGEAQGRMDLFVGAIGVFKNPASHRIVGNDHTEAVEAILLANTLLRLLDQAERATRRRGRPRTRP
jgi:uncharacterized protein (TIGR02391 family)